MQELRKICEELAAADPLEHQEAEDRSHLRDDEVADRILSIRAAYERYRERKIRDARATYAPLPPETSPPCHLVSCFRLLSQSFS